MPEDTAASFDLDDLVALTPWAVAGRYPEDIENPSAETASAMIDIATAVWQSVKELTTDD